VLPPLPTVDIEHPYLSQRELRICTPEAAHDQLSRRTRTQFSFHVRSEWTTFALRGRGGSPYQRSADDEGRMAPPAARYRVRVLVGVLHFCPRLSICAHVVGTCKWGGERARKAKACTGVEDVAVVQVPLGAEHLSVTAPEKGLRGVGNAAQRVALSGLRGLSGDLLLRPLQRVCTHHHPHSLVSSAICITGLGAWLSVIMGPYPSQASRRRQNSGR
jgi:hypothetical protein